MTQEEKQSIKIACKQFIQRDQKMNQKFLSFSQADQEWVLDYLSSGKWTTPYEIINKFDSLAKVPKKEFFSIEQFYYSSLKGNKFLKSNISSLKLYLTMKMEDIGELNKLYNFQDTIILCEICDTRANFLNEKI